MTPRPPRLLLAPALLVGAAMLLPLGYLLVRAADATSAELSTLLWRPRNLTLLWNTVSLAAGVVACSTLLAAPLAWLVTRTDLRRAKLVTVLAVLPLAVPGYVMAYSLLAMGGPQGAVANTLGFAVPRPTGYWGALLALSLYNFPYVFLTLRAAIARLDPGQVEAARSLGATRWEVLRRIVLPALRPALFAGALLVGLYVVGDFGVVSLMRFDTLSYALYSNWTELRYAAWLALALVSLASVLLLLELLAMRGTTVARSGVGTARAARKVVLGRRAWLAYGGVAALLGLAVVLPVATTVFWMRRGLDAFVPGDLWSATVHSVSAAVPAALVTVLLAVPIAWLAHRHRGLAPRAAERVVQLGYAMPPLALALGLVFFAIRFLPELRDGLWLLVGAFALHFLMLAMGPIRGQLHLLTPSHEEAARCLGCGPAETLRRVVLPSLRGGMAAGAVLVLLAAMKELPMTKLLAPLGFKPLSVQAWGFADEALYADAAPYALAMLLVSGVTAALVLRAEAT